jgi:hypothetical protein
MVSVIIAFNGCSIPDKGIEHHRRVHEVFICRSSSSQLSKGLRLGHRDRSAPHYNTTAMPAVRAVTVYGYRGPGTFNRDPVFLLVPQKR